MVSQNSVSDWVTQKPRTVILIRSELIHAARSAGASCFALDSAKDAEITLG